MENQDKIESQFKNAAEKSDVKDFPNMYKVWNRVEEKLDKKVLKKQNKLWKKIAVAASILLVASVGYQLLKPNPAIEIPQNNIVIIDTIQDGVISTNSDNAVAIVTDSVSVIKKDADKLLENVISNEPQVAIVESDVEPTVANDYTIDRMDAAKKEELEEKSNGYFAKRKFSAVGVQDVETEEVAAKEVAAKEASQKKEEPLLIIDNKAITTKDASNYKKISVDELSKLDSDDIQTVTYLKEPLYVIDGKQYSELEMFGPNPTSPYAPLSEQEIKTTVVLQGKEAIAAYGKKGEKGVLVITTKYGRPSKKTVKKP